MPASDREAESSLRGLLGQARSPELTPEAARKLRIRADEIARQTTSSTIASLRAQLDQLTEPLLAGPPLELSPRLVALKEEIERVQRPTASGIRRALEISGLAGDPRLDIEEAQALRNLLLRPLRVLRNRFELVDLDTGQLAEVVGQLDELRQAIPSDLPQPRAFLARLEESLQQRVLETVGHEDFRTLVRRLGELRSSQTGLDELPELERKLKENAWARAHLGAAEVAEGEKLVRQISDLRRAYERLAELRAVIAEKGPEIREALNALNEAHRLVEKERLVHPEELRRGVDLVVDSLQRVFDKAVTGAREAEPGLETLRGRINVLLGIRDWLHRIPGDAGPEARVLEQASVELAAKETERLDARVLAASQKRLGALPVAEIPGFANGLLEAVEVSRRELGRKLLERWEDLLAVRNVVEDVEDDRLRRLVLTESELGPSDFATEARELAESYRTAATLLDEVDREIEHGTTGPSELLERIQPFEARFPKWRRVEDVAKRVRDAERLRSIKRSVSTGDIDDVAEARATAAELADASLRERIVRSLDQLERAAIKARAANAERQPLTEGAELARLARSIDRAVAAASNYPLLEKEASASRAEFPGAWESVQSVMRPFIFDEIPGAVRRWLETSSAKVESLETLSELEAKFDGWSSVLCDDFLIEEARMLFGGISAELRIAEFTAQEKFDNALQLVESSAELLGAARRRRLEAELERDRAVHLYRSGQDPSLSKVMRAAKRHGLDERLLGCVVDDFRESGETKYLAELARSPDQELEQDPNGEALARWSRLFETRDLDQLAEALAAAKLQEPVALFLASIAKTASPAKGFYVVMAAGHACDDWDADTRAAAAQSEEVLGGRIERQLQRIGDSLVKLRQESRVKGDVPVSRDSSDPELRREIDEAFASARSFITSMRQHLDSWEGFLSSALRWLAAGDRFSTLQPLFQEVSDLAGQIDRSETAVQSLAEAKNRTLEAHSENLGELKSLLYAGSDYIAPVARLLKLVTHYFRDWLAVIKSFSELREASERGGTGMTSERVRALRLKLEKDLRYDFRPTADRFELLRLLRGKSWLSFIEELETQVKEVEEVEAYARECKEALRRRQEELQVRLKRLESATGAARNAERRAIASILAEPASRGRSLLDLLSNPPQPAQSTPAKKLLLEVLESSWYELLQRALAAQD